MRSSEARPHDTGLAHPIASSVFVVLALAGPPAFVVVANRLFGPSPILAIQLRIHLAYCVMAALLVWGALRVERLSLASIGVRPPTIANVVVAAAAVIFSHVVLLPLGMYVLGADRGGVEAGVAVLAALPVWFRVVLAITGGAIEETLYRGYSIERLIALTGRRWLGAGMAAVSFGLAHIPAWGSAFALAADLPFGILMTLVYVWRRDLLANVLAHSVALLIGLVWTL